VSYEQIQPLSYGGFKYECRVVRRHGAVPDGPRLAPILLIGGAFQDKCSWTRHEAILTPLTTVVTVDLPGCGTADTLPAEYGVEFLADAVHHLVVEIGLPRLNVMGGSYGSAVAYQLAHRHPDVLNRLLLCGTAIRIPDAARANSQATVDLLLAHRLDRFASSVVEMFLCQDRTQPVRRRLAIARMLAARLRAFTPDEIDKYVQNTRRLLDDRPRPVGLGPPMPTLVVTGEHDTFTTPALCREAAATCRDAQFTTVKEADHLLPLERMEEFLDLMVRFFAGESLAGLAYCTELEHFRRHPG
jgi:pimeloyl-ACP methyl ester carboxylesterase